MKKLVVLTGAGMSADSGIPTFRGEGGLWNGYRLDEVATPQAWNRDKDMVLEFYNERRDGVRKAKPNKGHKLLAQLESEFDIQIITQNIDDLHERAGSTKVCHLHGEIMKARSEKDDKVLYDLGEQNILPGDTCENGFQLRPHVVWFGEAVPMMERAIQLASEADLFVIIGTSLVVYPAASLVNFISSDIPIMILDPEIPELSNSDSIVKINKSVNEGIDELVNHLKQHL